METSLDRIVAGVQDTLNDPPGFSNRLNSVYMAIEKAIDRHQVFVGLHEEARLVTRQSLVLPANTSTRGLPSSVGNVRELRVKPDTEQLRQFGISALDLVSLVKLHEFQAGNQLAGRSYDYPPVLAAQWTEAATGKMYVEFDHQCSFDVPLEIVFEPAPSAQLDPDKPPLFLKQFYFLLEAEVARDLLPKFELSDKEYKRIGDLIMERLNEGKALLGETLKQNDSAKGGEVESFGNNRMRRGWR